MNNSLTHSLVIHAFVVGFFVVIMSVDKEKIVEQFNFEIQEKEIVNLNRKNKVVINAKKDSLVSKKNNKKIREVFGVKRNTIISKKGSFEAKIGNTITKKEDDKVLQDDESDSLPEPAEEFLITSMPRAIEEIRPKYPTWAKKQGLSGSVIFEILIDKNGKVRKAKLLRGLHPKLDKLAQDAIKRFVFKPAYIDKEPTAVRIKYAIKYILES
jgi:TonB family protein